MNHLPALPYSGLTVILSNPSRFDLTAGRLLSGAAGAYTRGHLLQHFHPTGILNANSLHIFDILQTRINVSANPQASLLPKTTVVILCGEQACYTFLPEFASQSINALRGSVHKRTRDDGSTVVYVVTYSPQDCNDVIDFEARLNPLLAKKSGDSNPSTGSHDIGDDDAEDEGAKDKARTSRDNFKFWFSEDIKKALRIYFHTSVEGAFQNEVVKPKYEIYPDPEVALAALNAVDSTTTLYLDIETDSSLNCNTIGIGINSDRIIVLPTLLHDYSLAYNSKDLGRLLRALQQALLKSGLVVIHNSLFDLFVLAWKYNITPPRNIYDTMLAQHRCYPEAEKSLGHCMSLWTAQPYHKDEGIFMPNNEAQSRALWAYNGKDIYGMRLIHLAQVHYASNNPGLRASIEQVNASIRPYLINSLLGIRLDTEQLKIFLDENDRLLKQYQRIIDALAPAKTKLLPTSSKSCVDYFHGTMHYPVLAESKKTGASKLDEKTLCKLKLQGSNNPLIDLCLKYRQTKKEASIAKVVLWNRYHRLSSNEQLSSIILLKKNSIGLSYLSEPLTEGSDALQQMREWFPKFPQIGPTGWLEIHSLACNSSPQISLQRTAERVTTGWKLAGTSTFRLASSKLLGRWGTNLQNPGKSQLKLYIPDPGKVFIQVDQAGAEALVVAYLCQHARFRELFLNGIKSHVYVCMHIYADQWAREGYPEIGKWLGYEPAKLKAEPKWKQFVESVKNNELRYAFAKMVCHASNYGMGPGTFRENVILMLEGRQDISMADSKKFLGTYQELFPEIKDWHNRTRAQVKATRILCNLFGYPRYFSGPLDESVEKEWFAFVPQSTVGSITNRAFTALQQSIERDGFPMDLLNNKHDSILAQVSEDSRDAGIKLLENALQQTMKGYNGVEFTMKTEASYGWNWAKYNEKDNPRGLRDIKL